MQEVLQSELGARRATNHRYLLLRFVSQRVVIWLVFIATAVLRGTPERSVTLYPGGHRGWFESVPSPDVQSGCSTDVTVVSMMCLVLDQGCQTCGPGPGCSLRADPIGPEATDRFLLYY